MKKIIVFSLTVISANAFDSCNNGNAVTIEQKEIINFYNVPLVCNAAPSIGCGSRAKPALLELEKNDAVKEAWLNRQGTVLAIVWNNSEKTKEVAQPVFEKNHINFSELAEKESKPYLETFRMENFWYRSSDVDKLSIEEAGTIAKDAVTFALNEKLISKQEADTLKAGIENFFKAELVQTKTYEELQNKLATNTFLKYITNIAAKHIGSERAEKITGLYMQKKSFEKKKSETCTPKCTEKESCCSKK